MAARVAEVEKGSIAERIGIEKGDSLLTINGFSLRDVLDYHLLSDNRTLEIGMERDGRTFTIPVVKPESDHLGLRFETSLFNGLKRCGNRCVFCFIDQLPAGVRDGLLQKDDDFRLSFLYGNFITLTNLSDSEVARIVEQRLSPLYVSLHTTDSELHRRMVAPAGKDKALARLRELLKGEIEVHVQIVLCPEYNDKVQLEKTLKDLSESSFVRSVGIVPVGLTGHRAGLPQLRQFVDEEVRGLVKAIERIQNERMDSCGEPWVYLADEFYLGYGIELPASEWYGDYPQIENGIGIARLFIDDVGACKEDLFDVELGPGCALVTGTLAASVLEDAMRCPRGKIHERVEVIPVSNRFLGGGVNVAGLVSGRDIIEALRTRSGLRVVLIPDVMLNDDGVFIDDATPEGVAEAAGVEVKVVPSDGAGFIGWLAENGE